MSANIMIIGSGMAGLGAAYQLRNEGVCSVIYDKNDHPGGHTSSWTDAQGFTFDEGPHISFTKNERIRELFAQSCGHAFEDKVAYMNNYWQGYWIKHPAQCNLYGLPQELIVKVLKDFAKAAHTEYGAINNYADWLLASYGESFAKTFPMEYGLKYHTVSAEKMSTDWLGPRLYKPDLEQVFNGALSPKTEDVHYITDFRYPTHNGFVSYLNMFIQDSDIKLSHHVVSVDADQKQVVFGNGVTAEYDYLISSMPLTELVPVIKNVPENVVYAVQQLACSMCVVVNIGLDRDNISEAHVSYFYDDDIVFTRLSFPHMQSVNNAPPGKGSIQAELYYSKKYKPFDKTPEQCIAPTINDLKRCGLIHDDDIVLSSSAKVIEYANIIYDLDRASAVATVLDYLKNVGIETCGRYGEWGYMWTDESFISGENAAQRILGRL